MIVTRLEEREERRERQEGRTEEERKEEERRREEKRGRQTGEERREEGSRGEEKERQQRGESREREAREKALSYLFCFVPLSYRRFLFAASLSPLPFPLSFASNVSPISPSPSLPYLEMRSVKLRIAILI